MAGKKPLRILSLLPAATDIVYLLGLEKNLVGVSYSNFQCQMSNVKSKPSVLIIEWLDPLMVAGHWIPEMVTVAGGLNFLTKPGQKSKIIKLHQIVAGKSDILIISPCGFDIKRIIKEQSLIVKLIEKLGKIRDGVYLLDGDAYMTRPGPRIVDGIEILAEILHPDIFPRRYPKKDWQKFML